MSSAASVPAELADARLMPGALVEVCVRSGRLAPSLHDGGRVVFLGCGEGTTVAAVAAAHPGLSVWAWDPVVEHVELTRRRAEALGLDNLFVHERDSVPDDLGGPADLVVLHDVLVTASDAARRRLVAAVGASLRVGGLLAVGYRTTVGWGSIVPAVAFLRHVVRRHGGDRNSGIDRAREMLRTARDHGAEYFAGRPDVSSWLDQLLDMPHQRITADYLQSGFRPMSHAQVVGEVAPLGCTFLGRAPDAADVAEASPELRAVIDGASNRTLAETYDDFAVRRAHRVDVFRLGDVRAEVR